MKRSLLLFLGEEGRAVWGLNLGGAKRFVGAGRQCNTHNAWNGSAAVARAIYGSWEGVEKAEGE